MGEKKVVDTHKLNGLAARYGESLGGLVYWELVDLVSVASSRGYRRQVYPCPEAIKTRKMLRRPGVPGPDRTDLCGFCNL